ncbi:MAG: ligase-associated DNA damage response endonuclease PdeM [Phycisphaerales bacterium]
MPPYLHPLTLAGEDLELLTERAIHWPSRRTLFIADVHFGKAAAFGHSGLPLGRTVIDATTNHDLRRLSNLLALTRAERLVILGDLLHAPASHEPRTLELVARWRASVASLHINLIRGNHDRRAGDPPADWRIDCHTPGLRDGPFALHHEPVDDAEGYALCGHIHPGIRLRGLGDNGGTVPCFVIGERRAVLPAFGSFTGSARDSIHNGDRLFAVGPENLFEIAVAMPRPARTARRARPSHPAQPR